MKTGKISTKISEDDPSVGYITLPSYPKKNDGKIVYKSIDLIDIIKNYKGPQVILDFDENSVLIGIEVIG